MTCYGGYMSEIKTVVNRFNIDRQLFTRVGEDVRAIARPLADHGIMHFSHLRRWLDGSYSLLTSDPAFSVEFIRRQFYKTVFGGKVDEYRSGMVFMTDIESHIHMIQKASIEVCGFRTDLMVSDATPRHVDFFWFGTARSKPLMHSFYLNRMDLIKAFISYFKEAGSGLLSQIYRHRLFNDEPSGEIDILRSGQLYQNPSADQDRGVSLIRASIDSNSLAHHMTPKELTCVVALCEGLSVKEIARQQNVSPRTIEKHIANIREKTGCDTTLKLVIKFLQSDRHFH